MDGLKARLSFDAVAYDYDDEYLTIDTDTHTININNVSRLFGVQYDGNSKLIKFRIRNKLSDIQKMQDSIVYINWIDSKGVKGQSIAINKTINNDTCEFAWKVPFDALKNSGVLHFVMSAVMTKNSSSVIDQRWSTKIASVITPDGIYIKSYTPSSEEEDRIAQIYNELSKMINKQNNNLQSQVSSLKEDITKFINKPTLEDNNKFPRALNGDVEWVEQGLPTDEQTSSAINKWLDAHPEATTTVQDGSIGYEKFSESFKKQIISVIHEKTGDITELINNTLKSNMHLRIYNSDVQISKGLSFKGLENVTLEFVDSKVTYLYDHNDLINDQFAILMENCKNVLITGLELTTDFSEENDESLDLSPLAGKKIYAINFTFVENGMIANTKISQFTDGLSINYSKDIYSFRNTFFNLGEEPVAFRNCSRCKMTDCEAYWYCGDGALVKHWDSYELSGFIFSNNYFHDGKDYKTGDGRVICGGGFTTNVEGNATVKRDPEYIIVKNNIFVDVEYGVLLAGGSHIIVDGNLVKSKQKSDGNYYTYAALGLDYSNYNLPDTQLYTDIKFINNTVEQASRGIYISKHSDDSVVITHEDILISGNIIKNCNNEAIETNDSLVYGNIFKNVKLIILYNTTFIANKVVGSSSLPQYSRFQANDSNIICNIMDMNGLYLDVRNTKDVSISYNTINTMNSIRVDWTSGYVYFTNNIYSSTPELRLLNNSQDYIVINGEPYKAKLIGGEYYSYTKRYGIVELDFISSTNVPLSKSGKTLGTLPEGYRPITISRHILYTNPSSGAIGVIVRIEIHPSGEVIAIAQENVSGAPIRGSLTFLAEQNSLN